MLTVKAKHATMLLTVTDVEGLSDGMEELSDEELAGVVGNTGSAAGKQLPAHPSVVMVSETAADQTSSKHMHNYILTTLKCYKTKLTFTAS